MHPTCPNITEQAIDIIAVCQCQNDQTFKLSEMITHLAFYFAFQENSKLTDIQTKESMARKLQGDMAVIEKTEREINELNRSLEAFKSSHGDEGKNERPLFQSYQKLYNEIICQYKRQKLEIFQVSGFTNER